MSRHGIKADKKDYYLVVFVILLQKGPESFMEKAVIPES